MLLRNESLYVFTSFGCRLGFGLGHGWSVLEAVLDAHLADLLVVVGRSQGVLTVEASLAMLLANQLLRVELDAQCPHLLAQLRGIVYPVGVPRGALVAVVLSVGV